ncbi:hypothetical protein Pst134EB_012936 [Puccinia striiformis f. sp. tritici]|nr:hypothetical protein Pst134EB_012936 [Puccinia striiformis f. sp. tritici]
MHSSDRPWKGRVQRPFPRVTCGGDPPSPNPSITESPTPAPKFKPRPFNANARVSLATSYSPFKPKGPKGKSKPKLKPIKGVATTSFAGSVLMWGDPYNE